MLKNLFKQNSVTNKYKNLINQINNLEPILQTLTDSELRAKTFELKKKYKNEQNLPSLIADSFSLVREASSRTLGLRHFDAQLIGGLVLNESRIAEMRTGEGKTLVATLPTYLNALSEKGVQVVTVNEYLAERDQVSMGEIYRFLGFDTGLIKQIMKIPERQQNYNADITYVTNSELGFDFLRDNVSLNLKNTVLRPFNYCIIDEIDSVLIDEAQTPLILAGDVNTLLYKFIVSSEVVEYLDVNLHFKVDEKFKNVILTEEGTLRVEKILNVKDLYNIQDPWIPYILNSLKAKALFFQNVHYIIQNNKVIIVDEFTGRIMPSRRWSDGLHQAIEAKEGLPVQKMSEAIASITYQNLFLLYPKLSGMTGTGKTAEFEFENIYGLSVDEIPTARPFIRNDLPDFIYKDQLSKWNAIAKECKDTSLRGQPILIGTTTVENSEMLAQLLKEYQLSYQLLNAKPENVLSESKIIAQAGKRGSITIATNMAGRGTDIILGGNVEFTIREQLYYILVGYKNALKNRNTIFPLIKDLTSCSQKTLSVLSEFINNQKFLSSSDPQILRLVNDKNYDCSIKFLINQLSIFEKKYQNLDNSIVKNLGGLYVIGTERNNSRRIDNQLRGRCGRQGDPGKSRFFLSLDDDLLRRFGGNNIQNFMQNQLLDDSPLESKLLTKSLDSAQQRVEEQSYDVRKYLFEYDVVLNNQRNVVYYERREVLESKSVRDKILVYGEQVICEITWELTRGDLKHRRAYKILKSFFGKMLIVFLFDKSKLDYINFGLLELQTYLIQEFWMSYETKSLELELRQPGVLIALERMLLLRYLTVGWRQNIQHMSLLRDAVRWRAYGQRNPLFEYKIEAIILFKLIGRITRQLVLYEIIRSKMR